MHCDFFVLLKYKHLYSVSARSQIEVSVLYRVEKNVIVTSLIILKARVQFNCVVQIYFCSEKRTPVIMSRYFGNLSYPSLPFFLLIVSMYHFSLTALIVWSFTQSCYFVYCSGSEKHCSHQPGHQLPQ